MNVDFKTLQFGQTYERNELARLWGYKDHHAIDRGVITPAGTNFIIFFVTKEKQLAFPQYEDYVDGDILYWEGEEKHSSDKRVIEANQNRDEIHLFYRNTHHTPFVYFGEISLTEFELREDAPSKFVFKINMLSSEEDIFREVSEYAGDYKTLDRTEQEQIVRSRIGQGDFRKNVIRLWGSCSVTGLHNISLLRASHIKPWKDSNNSERLNPYNGLLLIPNYDLLFDKGFITFRDNGEVIISQRLSQSARKIFDVSVKVSLRNVFHENIEYLGFHRDTVFK